MNLNKEDIADLRGETPSHCDFCQTSRDFDELEPEEAGAWVCHDCLRRWLRKDVDKIKVLLSWVYNEVDAAKWWFSPQTYFAGRTPHELILSDHSESLVSQLENATSGSSG